MTVSVFYCFDDFKLDTAARELWRDGQPVELSRLTFDGLAFLVENRDRAVSRDDLIEHVWGKPYVEDIQVTHLIMRIRRMLGDDSHSPRFVRTVPGFGYRWIADTETTPAPIESNGHAGPASVSPPHHRRVAMAAVFSGLLAVSLLFYFTSGRIPIADALPRGAGKAVVVLPIEVVSGADADADASWIRLGIMDMIAERLRAADLPTPPGDSVILALHAVGDESEAQRMARLRQTLGADVVVEGRARRIDRGWQVELVATTSEGQRRRVESAPADILPAAGQAANLLLAAFGKSSPPVDDGDEAFGELLQRVRAAVLALELDTARDILDQTPAVWHGHPEVLYQQAWIAFLAGEPETAELMVNRMLNDTAAPVPPLLRARGLILRGSITTGKRSDRLPDGLPDFEAALAVLEAHPWAAERGVALALRGLARVHVHDFNGAARDLGYARQVFEAAGDRLSMSRFHNYFGHLELTRKRPAEAAKQFQAALQIIDAFGHQVWARANLSSLVEVHRQLLQWPEALATGERLWRLSARLQDPMLRYFHAALYASVLVDTGRLTEAVSILNGLEDEDAEIPAQARYLGEEVRAYLEWQNGNPGAASIAAAQALELWSVSSSRYTPPALELMLLHQRTLLAAERGERRHDAPGLLALPQLVDDPLYWVLKGERAVFQGDTLAAEAGFREAMATAERLAVPRAVLIVVDAYARWLLDQGRVMEAVAVAGRVADTADHDYTGALLQVAVFHAAGQQEAWAGALRQAADLAGERIIPAGLRVWHDTQDPVR